MKNDNPIPESLSDDASGGIVEGLTTLQTEFAQLSELDEMENNYSKKLVEALKVLQSQVDIMIPLQKRSLGPAYSDTKEAFLASDCVLVMIGEDDVKRTVPLARFEPRYILSIAKEATPGLVAIISEKRREASIRVDIFERVLKEVKRAGNMVRQIERALPQAAGEDLVQHAITSE